MTDKDYKYSLIDLLGKIPNYFSKKNTTESMKFINALDNLVTQHLTKFQKTFHKAMNTAERQAYLLYVRNILFENKIATGQILELWVHCSIGDSVDNMEHSNKVKLSFDGLQNITNELKATKAKFSLRGFQLKDDIENYA